MDRVVVVCCGKLYKENEWLLKKYTQIVAYIDNRLAITSSRYKKSDDIRFLSFDKVLICSITYFNELKKEIEKYVDENDIVGIEYIEKLWTIEDKLKYEQDIQDYKEQIEVYHESSFDNIDIYMKPQYSDYRKQAGNIDKHYFYQDILVANLIMNRQCKKHFDIGSRLDGFISHLLVLGIEVTFVDIRPLKLNETNEIYHLGFVQADATNLESIPDNSIQSISSLHAIEHFGLGRYGDSVDVNAWKRALRSLNRVVAREGYLYLSVPVGKVERVEFNSHRIFHLDTIVKELPDLMLKELYVISDGITRIVSVNNIDFKFENESLGEYDCGIFVFQK